MSALLSPAVSVAWAFPTSLGWLALRVSSGQVEDLKFGYDRPEAALRALAGEDHSLLQDEIPRKLIRWQTILERFADGKPVDLASIPVELRSGETFAGRVQRYCRAIPAGQTMTYGALARMAGSPNAARAVGNVMRTNRIPLLIPCHRVVGETGWGGYSAPGGLATKHRLLELERASL